MDSFFFYSWCTSNCTENPACISLPPHVSLSPITTTYHYLTSSLSHTFPTLKKEKEKQKLKKTTLYHSISPSTHVKNLDSLPSLLSSLSLISLHSPKKRKRKKKRNKSLLRPLQNSHRETNKCILHQHHKQPSSRSSVQSEKHSIVNASRRKTLSSTPPSSVLLRPQSISKICPPSSLTSFHNGPSPTILTITAVATLFITHSVNLPPLLLPFRLCPTPTAEPFSSTLLSTISS